jgi:hypothetical protein
MITYWSQSEKCKHPIFTMAKEFNILKTNFIKDRIGCNNIKRTQAYIEA